MYSSAIRPPRTQEVCEDTRQGAARDQIINRESAARELSDRECRRRAHDRRNPTSKTASAPTRFVFHVSGVAGGSLDKAVERAYAPVIAELESRGFPSMLVHSSVQGSDTPNEDRASAVVKALHDVTDKVVIVGTSNEGNFLPLIAAARTVRRVVYVNALIPRPGKAFIEVFQTEQVAVPGSYLDDLLKASQSITDDFLKLVRNPNA